MSATVRDLKRLLDQLDDNTKVRVMCVSRSIDGQEKHEEVPFIVEDIPEEDGNLAHRFDGQTFTWLGLGKKVGTLYLGVMRRR